MPTAPDDDEIAIRRLMQDVYDAIWAKDFEAFARCHVQEEYARRWVWWMPSTLVVKEGWNAIAARIQQVMADPSMPDGIRPTVRRENYNIRIAGNMAWLTFDQEAPSVANRSFGLAGHSREVRVLEKHDGEWKIAFFGAISRNRPAPDFPRFRLDGEGRLLWKNEPGAAEIANGRLLTLRGGRLHSRDRAANRALQAAIRWASTLNLGFTVERGAVPILPRPAHGEMATIWWVTADAGVIEVAVHDRRLPDDKLALAAAVYGLSPAQTRIARGIVDGQALPELAAAGQVSLNTARTHLKRLFEKTGVRNQTALVRALLTVSAPD